MQSHVRAEDASNGGKRTEVGEHARRPPAIWGLPSRVLYFAPRNGGSPVQRPRSPPPWLAFAEPFSACKCGAARAAAAQERQGARIWIRICGQSWRAPPLASDRRRLPLLARDLSSVRIRRRLTIVRKIYTSRHALAYTGALLRVVPRWLRACNQITD